MNNPTYLKQQYQKISKKLHKAFTTGRFYQYTQYKQQRLLDKFSNYSLQLRKLGIAVAIGAGVSMAAPVQGQHIFTQNTGVNNPLDSVKGNWADFVDIDNDGDLDVITSYYTGNYTDSSYYYQNTGGNQNPNFVLRPSLLNSSNGHVTRPTFVDIDGDGDMDCFAGVKNWYYGTEDILAYYENTGSVTNPVFVQQPANLNPLDSINSQASKYNGGASFVDIDGDGDMDCLFHERDNSNFFTLHYYENIGTATVPNFVKNTTSSPFAGIPAQRYFSPIVFHDEDSDGDKDMIVRTLLNTDTLNYFENVGTATTPSFTRRQGLNNPYANTRTSSNPRIMAIVDLDQDGDIDCTVVNSLGTYQYLENITPSFIVNKYEKQIELKVFPNPTTGIIQLEEPLTGTLEVFNTLGQVLHSSKIQNQQQIDLSNLAVGNYFIKIQTEEGVLTEKVLLKK